MESIKIRKIIAKHLALSNKLQVAAKEVLENECLTVVNVATKYELECQILYRKINIMKGKEQFYDRKQKFETANKEIIEGKFTYRVASKHYGINAATLYYEMKKAGTQENYEYDRRTNHTTGFTYLQEESILKRLINWARHESLQGRCSCQLCALEKLLTLASEFVQENNIEYPLSNIHALIDWLIEFEMRHNEISRSFVSLEKCLKQIQADK